MNIVPFGLRGALLLLSLLGLFAGCRRSTTDTNDPLVLSGNIEAVDAQLGFRLPGRVAERLVSEGEAVEAGQVVARLEAREQQQELAVRRAELAAVAAALAELEAGSRPQEIAAAAASLRSAEAEQERARLDLSRQQELLQKEVISPRDFEAARALAAVAEAHVREAAERLRLIEEGPRPETLTQARARVEQARAAVALAETRLAYTELSSPWPGTVLAHHIESGEFVAAGTPVVTVADLRTVWVRAYLNEPDLGRIRHGQRVSVKTDSYPEKHYDGVIAFIASEAEFTPKTVQTSKERVRLVYRLKVDVANPDEELKPGMPAEVVIERSP